MENSTLNIHEETGLKVKEKQTSSVSEVHTDYFFCLICPYSIPFIPTTDFTFIFKIFKELIGGKKSANL